MSKPWSYSSLTAFETCPRRFKLTRVTKEVVEPQTEATTYGNRVHKALELAVRDGVALPNEFRLLSPLVKTVLAAPGVRRAEMKFGITRNFTPTDYWAKDVWCRGVIDYQHVKVNSVTMLDWKTGKPKPDSDQLKLFAAAGFSLHPRVERVRTGYVWLAHNRVDSETFTRSDCASIWGEFAARVQRMDRAAETNDYPPRPSGLCRAWCPVPRRMCEFSGKS